MASILEKIDDSARAPGKNRGVLGRANAEKIVWMYNERAKNVLSVRGKAQTKSFLVQKGLAVETDQPVRESDFSLNGFDDYDSHLWMIPGMRKVSVELDEESHYQSMVQESNIPRETEWQKKERLKAQKRIERKVTKILNTGKLTPGVSRHAVVNLSIRTEVFVTFKEESVLNDIDARIPIRDLDTARSLISVIDAKIGFFFEFAYGNRLAKSINDELVHLRKVILRQLDEEAKGAEEADIEECAPSADAERIFRSRHPEVGDDRKSSDLSA